MLPQLLDYLAPVQSLHCRFGFVIPVHWRPWGFPAQGDLRQPEEPPAVRMYRQPAEDTGRDILNPDITPQRKHCDILQHCSIASELLHVS